jgi:acetylornithine deacetylase/succinyl-diaminopimelate desuccinylase-like protein
MTSTEDAPLSETARIARDLIRFDTTNWGEGRSNGESDAAEYVGSVLRELGLETHSFDSAPGRTSVVTRVTGEDSGRTRWSSTGTSTSSPPTRTRGASTPSKA